MSGQVSSSTEGKQGIGSVYLRALSGLGSWEGNAELSGDSSLPAEDSPFPLIVTFTFFSN